MLTRASDTTNSANNNQETRYLERLIHMIHQFQGHEYYQNSLWDTIKSIPVSTLVVTLVALAFYVQNIFYFVNYPVKNYMQTGDMCPRARTSHEITLCYHVFIVTAIMTCILTGLLSHYFIKIAQQFTYYRNNSNLNLDFQYLADIIDEKLTALHDQFDALSPERKEELVREGLAEKDASGNITLKFICPISMQLITQPYELVVKTNSAEERHETYELQSINPWVRKRKSPLSTLSIFRHGYSEELNQTHLTYLTQLNDAVTNQSPSSR